MGTAPADERLSAYLDGELTETEAAQLEAELRADPSLRADLEELESVVTFLRQEGPATAPLGFQARVMERIEAEHPPVSSWWERLQRPLGIPWAGWGVALAAAVVLMVVLPSSREPAEVADRGEFGTFEPVEAEGADKAAPAAARVPSLEEPADPAPPAVEAPGTAAEGRAEAQESAERSTRPDVPAAGESPEPSPRGTADAEPALRGAPDRYVVGTEDVAALRALLAAVDGLGGSVQWADGTAVERGQLEASRERVAVRIPADRLAELESALGQLGSLRREFASDRLVRGKDLQVEVEFRLAGGSAATTRQPPKARRAMDKQLDSFEIEAPE